MNDISQIKNAFTRIYDENLWDGGSGPGSVIEVNREYIDRLTKFITQNNIKSVLDYGCGDWQFSKYIGFENLVDSYLGVDIVDSVINFNKENYSSEKVKFEVVDKNWKFDKVDLIVCRQVLQHLPDETVRELLDQFKTHSKYIILTNDMGVIDGQVVQNTSCNFGGFRPIDFQAPPWNVTANVFYDFPVYLQGFFTRSLLIKNDGN